MAERDFFRERHTIPGSLFLLLIILLNWNRIIIMVQDLSLFLKIDLVSGIALALFGTFGLTIIGFIISQIWFGIFWFGRYVGFKIIHEKNPAHVFLHKIGIKRNLRTLQSITDYFGITSNERISAYLSRRLDLLHTIGSSVIAILLACYITKYILYIDIELNMIFFLAFLITAMIFSACKIHLENLKMVEYILLLEYKVRYKFWNKIPNEYRENLELESA